MQVVNLNKDDIGRLRRTAAFAAVPAAKNEARTTRFSSSSEANMAAVLAVQVVDDFSRHFDARTRTRTGKSRLRAWMLMFFVVCTIGWATATENGDVPMPCPSSCSCLGSVVDCSRRGLIDVPRDIPTWVTMLDLQNNDITSISEDAFKGLVSLETLKIEHNRLNEIPDVGPLINLTSLSLHHNEIHSLNMVFLQKLTGLRNLDLNHNRLVDIPIGSFPLETPLQQLTVNNNRIVSIEAGAFDNLTQLEVLKMNKNRLTSIPKDLFRHMKKLQVLELNRNRLVTVEGLTFHGLDSLEVLKLQGNSISSLLDGAFYGLTNIQHLLLDHNNINATTKAWLYGLNTLRQLSLRRNKITEIQEDSWEFCQLLWELDMSHNELQMLRKNTFLKLPKLSILKLDHNVISIIEDGAFKGLSNLEILNLNNNEISWTVEDMMGAFVGLDNLQSLDLSSNLIKSLARHAFKGLDALRCLNLTGNNITSAQNNVFASLRALKELKLDSRSLLCDCQLSWLPAWLTGAHFQEMVVADCAHPEYLNGKSVFDVNPDDFACVKNDFPKPYMTEEPLTQISLSGDNVTLVCRAASTSASAVSFQWKKDNMVVEHGSTDNFARTSNGDVTEYTSRLHLFNMSNRDEGRYQCIISNHFGSTYSQKAKITVHTFPTFSKVPVNVTVRAGVNALLTCAAQGQPQPQIAWQKDGGDDFPAARERRMHVVPDDNIFYIMNTKPSDMGVYSCTAQNAAGSIMANITLTVLETPTFIKPMEDKVVLTGDTSVLECHASGSPKPKLTWTKDGAPLVPNDRHHFTAEGQLLVIVQTQPSDTGLYMCELSNTLGTERGVSLLSIASGTLSNEGTTAGIIIIAAVCCIVGTSLLWVVVIYRTKRRKRLRQYEFQDDGQMPPSCEVDGFNQRYSMECGEDCHSCSERMLTASDPSRKDGDERSNDRLLPSGLGGRVLGGSGSSMDSMNSTPSTHTTNSGEGTVPEGPRRLYCANARNNATEKMANRCRSCIAIQRLHHEHDNEDPKKTAGVSFATFPRRSQPASARNFPAVPTAPRWSPGSLRHLRQHKEVQNDSGSFSVASEDPRTHAAAPNGVDQATLRVSLPVFTPSSSSESSAYLQAPGTQTAFVHTQFAIPSVALSTTRENYELPCQV